MAKKILKAKVKDVHLPPTDAKSAFERLLELQNPIIRARDHLEVTKIYSPSLLPEFGDYLELENNTDNMIPPGNQLFRIYNDGLEQLFSADDDGEMYAYVCCVSNGSFQELCYNWNIADGGMYQQQFDSNALEVEWE